MKIFFCAPYHMAGGPGEVNRNLVSRFPEDVLIKRFPSGAMSLAEAMWKITFSDVVVFSGITFNPMALRLAHRLGKKIVYIMHGCIMLETGSESAVENHILEYSDKILCVSDMFASLMRSTFPAHAAKIGTLTNGIVWDSLSGCLALPAPVRDPKRIILFGGGRELKHNLEVCQAVCRLNEEKGLGLHVDVYGYHRANDRSAEVAAVPGVTFHHVIPHDEVNLELRKAGIYIQNSTMEPFGLAVIDAIALGCDVLVSKHIGSSSLIRGLRDEDVISNPLDVEEIMRKIEHLLANPNNERLNESIDRDSTSAEAAAARLLDICHTL